MWTSAVGTLLRRGDAYSSGEMSDLSRSSIGAISPDLPGFCSLDVNFLGPIVALICGGSGLTVVWLTDYREASQTG